MMETMRAILTVWVAVFVVFVATALAHETHTQRVKK